MFDLRRTVLPIAQDSVPIVREVVQASLVMMIQSRARRRRWSATTPRSQMTAFSLHRLLTPVRRTLVVCEEDDERTALASEMEMVPLLHYHIQKKRSSSLQLSIRLHQRQNKTISLTCRFSRMLEPVTALVHVSWTRQSIRSLQQRLLSETPRASSATPLARSHRPRGRTPSLLLRARGLPGLRLHRRPRPVQAQLARGRPLLPGARLLHHFFPSGRKHLRRRKRQLQRQRRQSCVLQRSQRQRASPRSSTATRRVYRLIRTIGLHHSISTRLQITRFVDPTSRNAKTDTT